MRRVVITGMGTVNPLGKNVEEFWENIKANKNGLSYVDQFDTENFPVKIVGAVKDFDCTEYIDKKEAKKMAADNLELFLSKLEEKGLQIIEKNVMMDKEKNSYIFQGTVLTKEKIESYRATKQLEVPKEEGTVENESE